jgi:DNA-binding transcriptional LysR family regulator
MSKFTLNELQCFDAVVREGSFQAAADKLHRTHPTVFAAVRKLERQLALKLLDRSGYRVAPTQAGHSFLRTAQELLRALESLQTHAAQLAMGQESELRIVVGDLCPLPETLGLLKRFFSACPGTRLHLHFEAISGPWERLFDGDADLILHHIDHSDPRLDFIELFPVQLIPVVAPGFLPFRITNSVTHQQMRDFCQCIIRDTARHSSPRNYFVLEGARQWTVADQLMKKEVIVQGMGWGHMPSFLISQELRDKRLLSISGRHFPGAASTIVAARRRDIPHGPTAKRLWRFIQEQVPIAIRSVHTDQPKVLRRQRIGAPAGSRRQGIAKLTP